MARRGPDEMNLEQMRQAIDWIEGYHQNRSCPICASQTWVVVDHLVQAPVYSMTATTSGTTYPQVLLVCNTCGYTLSFNAVVMGIVPTKEAANG